MSCPALIQSYTYELRNNFEVILNAQHICELLREPLCWERGPTAV